jgi:CheY-like chemotaxis protein
MDAKTVLLVDDDVDLLDINRITLEAEGSDVVTAENEAQGSGFRSTDRDKDPQWLPVDRFIDKPVKPEDLVSMVRTLAGAWTFTR